MKSKYSANITQFFINKNKIKPFILFFLLKHRFGGRIEEKHLKKLVYLLSTSKSSTKKHLSWLIKNNLVEKQGNWYYATSSKKIKEKFCFKSSRAINFQDYLKLELGKTTDEQLKHKLQNIKEIRTFLHIAVQEVVCKGVLAPKIRHKERTNKVSTVRNKATLRVNCYDVSSSFISNILSIDNPKGFSAPTIRKHQLRADKARLINRRRVKRVLACTEEFRQVKFAEKSSIFYDFSVAKIESKSNIVGRAKYSQISDLEKKKGCSVAFQSSCGCAILQEVEPKIIFNNIFSLKTKFSKKSKSFSLSFHKV